MTNTTTPLLELYPYQKRWINDDARFKIGMWARQTGKTFSSCAEIVRACVKAEAAGKRTRWVILSRGERQAREAMEETVKPLTRAFCAVYDGLHPHFSEEDVRADTGIAYKSLEVRFAHGSRITALPANPDTARGFSANVLLDEFAFHHDSNAIWRALFPVISRPGLKLRVVSTPNGKSNKFYALMTKSEGWSRHRTTIDEAVEMGCPRDIAELRRACGDDELWRREYLLEWRDEALAWLSYDMIDASADADAGKPEHYARNSVFIGNDIARHKDLWVAVAVESVGDVLWLRQIEAHRGISFAEQDKILDAMVKRFNPVRIAMDRTGMGERSVESAEARYGRICVEGVVFTPARRLDLASAMKRAFETRCIRIPDDAALREDLHAIRWTQGATGHPRLADAGKSDGHADRFWALAMAVAAAQAPRSSLTYTSTHRARVGIAALDARTTQNPDTGFGAISGGSSFAGWSR